MIVIPPFRITRCPQIRFGQAVIPCPGDDENSLCQEPARSLIVGTRPEAIKMAPILRRCTTDEAIDPIICFTGQHREMLAQVADYFGLKADVDLDLMRPNQSLSGLTSRCLEGLDAAIQRFSPDCIVAQGDTTTVMTASVAAFLSSASVRSCRSRLADGQPPFALAGGIQSSRRGARHFRPLRTHADGGQQSAVRRSREVARPRHRQHRHRCASLDTPARTTSLRSMEQTATPCSRQIAWF